MCDQPLGTPVIPDEVLDLFDGSKLEEKVGLAYELVTTDDDGRPRVAMLSHGEILVTEGEITLALWPDSVTSFNLNEGRSCLLSIVVPGAVWYLLGRGERISSEAPLACFRLRLQEARGDRHAGFPVVGPISFSVEREVDLVLAEWRTQHRMMRASVG